MVIQIFIFSVFFRVSKNVFKYFYKMRSDFIFKIYGCIDLFPFIDTIKYFE